MQRIYEWTWHKPDGTTRTTRSTRSAHAYKVFAERVGGKVTRRVAGFRLPELTRMAEEALEEESPLGTASL